MRSCADCSRPLLYVGASCDFCSMRDRVAELHAENRRLRRHLEQERAWVSTLVQQRDDALAGRTGETR